MPNFLGSDDTAFLRTLASMHATGRTLASQPNTVIANNAGQPVLSLGLATVQPGGGVPSGDGIFALQLLDPATQAVVLQVGEQFAGIPGPGLVLFSGASPIALLDGQGVTIYDSSGDPLTTLTASGVTIYAASGSLLATMTGTGITIYATSGNPAAVLDANGVTSYDAANYARVRMGLLPGGDYGLGVYNDSNDGAYIRIAPPVTASYQNTQTTTSKTPVPLSGPSVSFPVSQSGQALVLTSSIIGMPGETTAVEGLTQVLFNGSSSTGYAFASASVTSATAVALQTTASGMQLVTGLPPGTNSAAVYYSSTYGQSIEFTATSITVIPY